MGRRRCRHVIGGRRISTAARRLQEALARDLYASHADYAATIAPRTGRDAAFRARRLGCAASFAAQESVARPKGGSRPNPSRHIFGYTLDRRRPMPGARFFTRSDAPPQDGLRREDASHVTHAVRQGPPRSLRGQSARRPGRDTFRWCGSSSTTRQPARSCSTRTRCRRARWREGSRRACAPRRWRRASSRCAWQGATPIAAAGRIGAASS